jgi:hypothetical protein
MGVEHFWGRRHKGWLAKLVFASTPLFGSQTCTNPFPFSFPPHQPLTRHNLISWCLIPLVQRLLSTSWRIQSLAETKLHRISVIIVFIVWPLWAILISPASKSLVACEGGNENGKGFVQVWEPNKGVEANTSFASRPLHLRPQKCLTPIRKIVLSFLFD